MGKPHPSRKWKPKRELLMLDDAAWTWWWRWWWRWWWWWWWSMINDDDQWSMINDDDEWSMMMMMMNMFFLTQIRRKRARYPSQQHLWLHMSRPMFPWVAQRRPCRPATAKIPILVQSRFGSARYIIHWCLRLVIWNPKILPEKKSFGYITVYHIRPDTELLESDPFIMIMEVTYLL